MNFFLIDTLSPFFTSLPEHKEYNWSKVPFSLLEDENGLNPYEAEQILTAFKVYIKKIKEMGYNAVTLDELCRMVIFEFYPLALRKKLKTYEKFYREIFLLLQQEGLKVFVTTDIMFYNQSIEIYLKKKKGSAVKLMKAAIRLMMRQFPSVDGVVFRLGESDGLDVEGDFISRLFVKKPKQCRRLIRDLIPLFEEKEKFMIIRSWTLGAYSIGDLMWNKETLHKVFHNIESDFLIISHKYGESDFFRYLNLNPLFFENSLQKIIELQAKREYEGFGEFPCYIGNDYERIYRYLQSVENMVGIMVWCQTGGWSHFNRLTFGRNSSFWTEINTYTIIKIYKDQMKSENAVQQFCREYIPDGDDVVFLKLLRLSERILRDLWYLPEYSAKRLYFRRSRIPTLLWIVWDQIIISHMLRRVLRPFVLEKKEAVIDGYRALDKIEKLKKYADELHLDRQQFDYMYDTYHIIALGREYYLGRWNPEIQEKIIRFSADYREKYPYGFHIRYDFSLVQPGKWMIKTIFRLAIRETPHYRLIDRLFLIRFSKLIYFLFSFWQKKKKKPDFLDEQAMGVQVLFK
jgi:hypothetical protein